MELRTVGKREKMNLIPNSQSTWKKVKEAKGWMMDVSLGRTPEYENLEMGLSFNIM